MGTVTNAPPFDTDLQGLMWTTYAPTVTTVNGALTSVSASGRYKRIGKTVFVRIRVAIATNGTGATAIDASLPFSSNNVGANEFQAMSAREVAVVGTLCGAVVINNSSLVRFTKADGTYPGADGYVFAISGSYESA